ncbi:putative nucleotidyltransferase [Bacillus ectoiniformans]|uniref:nucleotidyltransferase domain-containing protein n=1 Tax=Bacillus ectoiniformans TaxID=1494429 RepID=UPI00195E1B1E|nr:nucleotidyltransferase domain-containing protein [Bacillus ectoiniformans]MBM7649271.1 putative nucleotidyltransferase [Bacillus ectoiniformans]
MFGLLERDIRYIKQALGSFDEIERAVIFGSRAMGNYKKGSDVDLAIIGTRITPEVLYGLTELLNEEYPLPYFFDILDYHTISNQKLIEHIDQEGKEIYIKS